MRLNIGSGPVQPDGWFNVDPDPQWGAYRWPLPPSPVAGIGLELAEGAVAHHVLQLVSWHELDEWLVTVRMTLASGGWLRVSVPDFPRAYAAALDGDADWFPIADEHERTIDGKLCMYLTQAGATRSIFTGPWLCDLFRRAGFVEVHQAEFGRTRGPAWLSELDNRPTESIIVEGRRP